MQHRFFCRVQRKAKLKHVPLPRRSSRERFEAFLSELSARNGFEFLVVKETFHERGLGRPWCNFELLDGFAAGPAPVIGVIRHPYDTAASTVRLLRRLVFGPSGWLMRRLLPNVPRFRNDTEIIRWSAGNYAHFAEWARRRNLFLVRYEDLVNGVERQLSRMCAHSGIRFDPRMLDHHHPRTAFGGIGSPEVLLLPARPVNRNSIGRGRQLTRQQRDILRAECAECAAEFGYSL
jgi:hypothetical protein